jgi:hypothetical protein
MNMTVNVNELDRVAEVHLRAISTYDQRKASALKHERDAIALLEDERAKLQAAFAADMERIDHQIAGTRSATEATVTTAEKLAAASRAALGAIAS